MSDPTPEAVVALAAAVNPIQWGGGGNDLKARFVAENILADPGPLLDALVEAGVLEVEEDVEWCDDRCSVWTHYDGRCGHGCRRTADHPDEHECVNGHTYPRAPHFDEPTPRRRRYVSRWEADDA